MKYTICLLLFLPFLQLAAQPQYRKGYIIGLDGQRTECLILVHIWWKNPQRITWTLESGARLHNATPKDIREFGIYGMEKYIAAEVLIDTTGLDADEPGKQPNIVWTKKALFLRVLIEGQASLYYYEQRDLRRFFYTAPDVPLSQLIYRVYQKDEETAYRYMGYMSQLWQYVRCGDISEAYVQSISHSHEDLMRYFREYNTCSSEAPAVNHIYTRRRPPSYLRLCPGINVFDFSFTNRSIPPTVVEYGLVHNLRLALEFEIFPFGTNNWSTLFEPAFQYMRLDNNVAKLRYNAIEPSVGLRRYLYVRPNSTLFSNIHYTHWNTVIFDSRIDFAPPIYQNLPIPIKTVSPTLSLGFGYTWMNKLSAEIRFTHNKNIIGFIQSRWKSTMSRTVFILSYNLFSRSTVRLRNIQS